MKYKINTGKPNTPTGVIITMPVFIIAMIGLFIAAFWQGVVHRSFDIWFWFSLIAGIIIWLYGDLCDRIFNYYEDAWVEFDEKHIVYGYKLNNRVLSTSDTSVKVIIKDINKVKIHHSYVVVRGMITKKAPLRKVVSIKECKIMLDREKRGEIIECIKSFAGKERK